ncbi:MAG: desulfoferrodoxin family protein [Bacillota bacterium]
MKFYTCSICNQLFLTLFDEGKKPVCCDEAMLALENKKADDKTDDHFPKIRKVGNFVTISVGDGHPMVDVHHIAMIFMKTNQGFQYRDLSEKSEAKADFILAKGETILNAYVYCNVHQLWSLH